MNRGSVSFPGMHLNPLPFRVGVPGRDTMDLELIESVSSRIDGLLHLRADGIRLEWQETETREQVSLERVGTDVERYELQPLELPYDRIAGAWVIGGWWWPRLELRARSFADLEGVPGARGITLMLRIQRRDRALARAVAAELVAQAAAGAAQLPQAT